jgi:hypothetical protein
VVDRHGYRLGKRLVNLRESFMKKLLSGLVLSSCLLASGFAMAQGTDKPAAGSKPAGPSDHSQVVGTFGVGWYGVGDVPIGSNPADGSRVGINVPAIGARYWLNELLGIDGAIGFNTSSGSQEITTVAGNVTTTTKTDDASRTGFWFHFGVPLALAHSSHFAFLIIPEANVAFGSGKVKAPAPPPNTPQGPDLSQSGFKLNIGARAGGEIHFGFMGLPRLSLEGSVGLFMDIENTKAEQGPAKSSHSTFQLATSSINQPWDFFRGIVAARYYF